MLYLNKIIFLSNITFAKHRIGMKSECILCKFKNGKMYKFPTLYCHVFTTSPTKEQQLKRLKIRRGWSPCLFFLLGQIFFMEKLNFETRKRQQIFISFCFIILKVKKFSLLTVKSKEKNKCFQLFTLLVIKYIAVGHTQFLNLVSRLRVTRSKEKEGEGRRRKEKEGEGRRRKGRGRQQKAAEGRRWKEKEGE